MYSSELVEARIGGGERFRLGEPVDVGRGEADPLDAPLC